MANKYTESSISSHQKVCDHILSLTQPQKAFRSFSQDSGRQLCKWIWWWEHPKTAVPTQSEGGGPVLYMQSQYPEPSLAPSDACEICTSCCSARGEGARTASGEITDETQRQFPDHPSWRVNSFLCERRIGQWDNSSGKELSRGRSAWSAVICFLWTLLISSILSDSSLARVYH